MSDPVPATTRAVKVEALNSCSGLRDSLTTVRLKTQEIQLVIVLRNFETVGLARKCRLDLDLFKNRHRKDLQQCVERRLQAEPFAHDSNQHIDRNGDPDLRLHGVLRRAIEPFDPQVLFDPFEKKASSLLIMGSNETPLLGKPVLPTSSCFLVRLTGGRFFLPA